MLTRCPACETTFRITPEQLKLRQGKVRCGECQHVFNALDSLIEEAVVALIPSPAPAPTTLETLGEAPSSPNEESIAVSPEPTFEAAPALVQEEHDEVPISAPPTLELEPEPEPEQDLKTEPEPEPEPELDSGSLPAALADPAPTGDAVAADDTPPADPLLHETPNEGVRSWRWLWLIASFFAILALAAQVALHLRTELVVMAPEMRPLFESVCEAIGCRVELPMKVELMTIEASDLQPIAEQKGVLKLTATLRNRAPFHQAFPYLELSLTNADNRALARRILRPEDYLPQGVQLAKGMANGETTIGINIDSTNVGANGYRLYLFYP